MLYALVPLIALIIHFIINSNVLFSNTLINKKPTFRRYRIFLYSVALFYTIDFFWGVFDHLGWQAAGFIDTSLYFVAMGASVLAWTFFIVSYLKDRKVFNVIILTVGILIFLGSLSIIIANFFHPILFSYNNAVYIPKVARYAFLFSHLAMYFLCSIYTVIEAFVRFEGLQRTRHLLVGIVGFIMTIAVVLQMCFPLYPAYGFGLCIGNVVVQAFIIVAEKNEYLNELKEGKDQLGEAKSLAYKDTLTGLRSKHAYVEMEEQLDEQIREQTAEKFAIIVFDLNDLKIINDTLGHEVGDDFLKKSAETISKYFPFAESYRYGGDEFVAVLKGETFLNRYESLEAFNKEIEDNIISGGPIIATGIAEYIPQKDNTFRSVFNRADEKMYAHKRVIKERQRKLKVGDETANIKERGLRGSIYQMFYESKRYSIADFLNNSSCDEVVEVNLNSNTLKQIYHVDGKYFVPEANLSYSDIVEFTVNHGIHPDDREEYLKLMRIDGFFERLRNSEIPNFAFGHFRYKCQNGEYRYVEQCVIAGEEYGVKEGCFRFYVFDIDNYMNRQHGTIGVETNIEHNERDAKTHLYIDKVFFARAEELVRKHKDKTWALISLDIEHFKFFDEWYGREKGDYLLAKVGAALFDAEKEFNGLGGYFGQDDFVFLVEYDMKKVAKLYDKVRSVILSFGQSVGFMPSFGVAVVEDGMRVIDAFDRATIAGSKSKTDVTKRITVYNSKMQFMQENEYRILSEFMSAFRNDEITFFLQPQCRISSRKIVGAESLARWIKKDGTMVSPADFVPVLEKYGFIADMDKYLWEKVCKWLRGWLDAGHTAVPISLNISRIDIFTIDIAKTFDDLTKKYNIPHELIKLEITESAYSKNTGLLEDLVDKLRSKGFLVLMDDFGSGYSSLNMLSSIKVDAIKLDANFLKLEGEAREKGIRILESIVHMAKQISLPVIVEGVETKEQSDFLEGLGCRYAQGFGFYRPMNIENFEKTIGNVDNLDMRGFVGKSNDEFRMRELLDKNIYSDSMLNSILGPVAIYSLRDNHVDIVRYNQQFYEVVGVPDFVERLENIERFLPPVDVPKIFKALNDAIKDKLNGSTALLRFYKTDGSLSSYIIHFFHLGMKEGTERFYGSAQNVTELVELKDERELFTQYSEDNLVFVRKVNDKWSYSVASHGLSDVLRLTPKELEKELNSGKFSSRIIDKKDFASFMKLTEEYAKNKQNFNKTIVIKGPQNKRIKLLLTFYCLSDQANSIEYVMRSEMIKE